MLSPTLLSKTEQERSLFYCFASLMTNELYRWHGFYLLLVLPEDSLEYYLSQTFMADTRAVCPIDFAAAHVVVKSSKAQSLQHLDLKSEKLSSFIGETGAESHFYFGNNTMNFLEVLKKRGFNRRNVPLQLGGDWDCNRLPDLRLPTESTHESEYAGDSPRVCRDDGHHVVGEAKRKRSSENAGSTSEEAKSDVEWTSEVANDGTENADGSSLESSIQAAKKLCWEAYTKYLQITTDPNVLLDNRKDGKDHLRNI